MTDRLRGKRLRRVRAAAARTAAVLRDKSGPPELVIMPRVRCPDCPGGVCPVDGKPCPLPRPNVCNWPENPHGT